MVHAHNKDNLLKNIDNIFVDNDKISVIEFHWYDASHFNKLKKVMKNIWD